MIARPLIILGAPRSGTTILHRCLALHPDLWHLPGESHAILEGPLHPAKKGYESNRCTASELADEALLQGLRRAFYERALNLNRVLADPRALLAARSLGERLASRAAVSLLGRASRLRKPAAIRFLEKTPRNMLRIPLLERLFPDARYIWLRRAPAPNIDSLISGWFATDRIGPFRMARFARAGYPLADRLHLRDYKGSMWKFALVPEWQDLRGKSVADVAAWQYYQCNRYAAMDLGAIDPRRVFVLQNEVFVREPVAVLEQILAWADLPASPVVKAFARVLPQVNDVGEGRRQDGKLRYPDAVAAAMEGIPGMRSLAGALGYAGT